MLNGMINEAAQVIQAATHSSFAFAFRKIRNKRASITSELKFEDVSCLGVANKFHAIKHSRGRIEDLVNSLSKPLPSADSIALWWFSVLNMDRKLRLWSEALDSELQLRASRIKEEALKALIMPEGWPIRNLGVETVNFMRRMERKGYVKRHAGRYHALVKTNSNHAPLN